MLAMFSSIKKVVRDARGTVSVEWILLAIIIMSAVVFAFVPTFQTSLQNGTNSVSNTMTAESAAGS